MIDIALLSDALRTIYTQPKYILGVWEATTMFQMAAAKDFHGDEGKEGGGK